MNDLWLLIGGVVLVCGSVAAYFRRPSPSRTRRHGLLAKPMLSAAQREVFTQLVTALPEQRVFPSVALVSFIGPQKLPVGPAMQARLQRIGRCVADVLICDATWRPVAIVAFATKRRFGMTRVDEHDGMLKRLGIDVHVVDPSVQLEVQALIGKLKGTGDA
ncbi:DUF2726 domain-containing protein [Burkholderia territorii]|uniref:DUF2726 domain-containing protein n=1 Tax=Burkholderia territorii TaxID=1503055 RepID=UPI0009BEF138|nr:DUF2726 domain-containing protein [Burkholderia territorii]